jgi:hypothetical protein
MEGVARSSLGGANDGAAVAARASVAAVAAAPARPDASSRRPSKSRRESRSSRCRRADPDKVFGFFGGAPGGGVQGGGAPGGEAAPATAAAHMLCDLDEIFGRKPSGGRRGAAAKTPRGSSANWSKDGLTAAETLAYRRVMGFDDATPEDGPVPRA